MPLMYCPDCGGTVSASARSCPHCGCPFEDPQQQAEPDNVGFVVRPQSASRRRVQPIELTGKKYKFQMAFGTLLMIAGLGALSWGFHQSSERKFNDTDRLISWAGAASFLIGLISYCLGRFGAWWHHG